MDILGPLLVSESGNKFILVVGDYFLKWIEAYALPDQEAVYVCKKVYRGMDLSTWMSSNTS